MTNKKVVNDKTQKNYTYYLTEPIGKNFSPIFHPELTPQEMLEMGVFGGKYMTDLSGRSAWAISAILQILYGKERTGRGTSDQTPKSYDETCKSNKK